MQTNTHNTHAHTTNTHTHTHICSRDEHVLTDNQKEMYTLQISIIIGLAIKIFVFKIVSKLGCGLKTVDNLSFSHLSVLRIGQTKK